ncbi:nucleoplasmin-like [Leucoraja erinacea]|uniref:nucleoplasmin-like n=1 Tax=Leucoraja erinaceus TaxID=7782 RepID=UPI0024568872|nr:nucleoplasmin-like [Leucoraja erinacea]
MISNKSLASKMEKPVAVLWGCELNTTQKTQKFVFAEDDSDEHHLVLKTICLGAGTKDELNVVEIVPEDGSLPVPIASLRLSSLPMVVISGIELTSPVTFRLKCGSGPVYLMGENMILEDETWEAGDEEEEAEEEEEEEDLEEETPPKKVKRPAPTRKTGLSKKKRLDTDKAEAVSGDKLPATGKDSNKPKSAKN